MLKQSFSKAKKVLTILLAVLFVASLTVGAASACHSHGHHHSCGSCSSYGSPHSHTCGCSHSHTCVMLTLVAVTMIQLVKMMTN